MFEEKKSEVVIDLTKEQKVKLEKDAGKKYAGFKLKLKLNELVLKNSPVLMILLI